MRLTASLREDLAIHYRAAHWPASSRWMVSLSRSVFSSFNIDALLMRQPNVSNGGTLARRSL